MGCSRDGACHPELGDDLEIGKLYGSPHPSDGGDTENSSEGHVGLPDSDEDSTQEPLGLLLPDVESGSESRGSLEACIALPSDGDSSSDRAIICESSDDDRGPLDPEHRWLPGENCGDWVHRHTPLAQQSQILISNVFKVAQRLSVPLQREILQALAPSRQVQRNYTDEVAAAFLGTGRQMPGAVCGRVERNNWQPIRPLEPVDTGSKGSNAVEQEARDYNMMKVLVREVLSNAYHGRPDSEYVRAIRRLALNGVLVGSKYHFPAFRGLCGRVGCSGSAVEHC